eukprot:7961493-Pyramimonas_sp.AAC.1
MARCPRSGGTQASRGERVLGMLPLPVKLWSRARSSPCSEWQLGPRSWATGSSTRRVGVRDRHHQPRDPEGHREVL